MSAQMSTGQYGQASVWNPFGSPQGMFPWSPGSQFQPFVMPQMYSSAMPQSNTHFARQSRTGNSSSVTSQDFWLLDSGATHHMTSELSNLNMATLYPSNDTVTSANGEGLAITHIGSSSLPIKSHNFKLNSVLHVSKLSQHLLSINQLCKDNKCRCIIDDFSLCI